MMFRQLYPRLTDVLINHPDIRPTIERGDHRLYAEDIILDARNIVFAGEEGVVIFKYLRPGEYQGHIGFLKEHRGRPALAACRYCLDKLFTHFDAHVVLAAVPLQLRGARMLCRLLGFVSKDLDTEQEWLVFEGRL